MVYPIGQIYYIIPYIFVQTKGVVTMKLPNGYGSVYKLSGKRRNPYAARITVGWKDDFEKQKSYPVYKFIGFYSKKADALQALADYHHNPLQLSSKITLEDLYNKWFEHHFGDEINYNSINTKSTWKICAPIKNINLCDLKLTHYQNLFNESGKNLKPLIKLKSLLGMMYDYAVMYEIISKDKRDMIRYIDLSKFDNPNKITRKVFTKDEIIELWNSEDVYASAILILIFTGLRIGELISLKKEDVKLDEQYFNIIKSKTKSGIRQVPIADKLIPLFKKWMENDSEYLICSPTGKKIIYNNFRINNWNRLAPNHTLHDTRHTFISMMTAQNIDSRIIKKIVGHSSNDVTQNVYTHIDLKTKLDVVNLLLSCY